MKDHVIIRSSSHGLEVCFNPDIDFETLLQSTASKFKEAKKFFAKAQLAVAFEGRDFTKEEEYLLVQTISNEAGVDIVCIIDNNHTRNILYKTIVDQCLLDRENRDGQFYKGTLKRRQVLESDKDIIILGNIESGAKVISKGNVVVMGTIKGSVHAGMGGDTSCYIAALSLEAKILKIADYSAKRHILQEKNDISNIPKIAILDGEHIYIDPLL